MKKFLSKHKRKIIFGLVFIAIIGFIVGSSYLKHLKNKDLHNTHHAILITFNPTTGGTVPIEVDFYERIDKKDFICFNGISAIGTLASAEIDRRFIIMISTGVIPELVDLKQKGENINGN
jgi:hypothetical protein